MQVFKQNDNFDAGIDRNRVASKNKDALQYYNILSRFLTQPRGDTVYQLVHSDFPF